MPRRFDPWTDDRLIPGLVVVMLVVLGLWLLKPHLARHPERPGPLPPVEGYLFSTWNVENLFDDQDDPRNHDDVEDWFARHPDAVYEKVDLLARALLAQNGGRGPDILALVEVENRHAVELLRDALNAMLPTGWRYDGLIHRDNVTGRRIEPAVLTRLPARDDLTRTFGIRRILEVHLESRGAPLVVLASHWTSRIRGDGDAKRSAYADILYGAFVERASIDPAVDMLISGDFNDEPDDPSIREHLHSTDDPAEIRLGAVPSRLLDLTALLDAEHQGTYLHEGRWQVLDHIVASPGLLDPAGWVVLPDSIRTENAPELRFGRDRRPWRFGGPKNANPRGPSDHFAVTVRLQVHR